MIACSHGASSVLLLPRGVRRALDAMRANVSHDWSLADLADILGMSGRTLQRQFRSFIGKTRRARCFFISGEPSVALCDLLSGRYPDGGRWHPVRHSCAECRAGSALADLAFSRACRLCVTARCHHSAHPAGSCRSWPLPLTLRLLSDLTLVPCCGTISFAFIALFRRFAFAHHAVLESLSASSYGMYLIHYPVVVWLQFALLAVAPGPITKGAIVSVGAVALSWGIVVALRRVPAIARVL
jgi:AraC-like DNA-binding protein